MGSFDTDKKHRKRLAKRLRAKGVPANEVRDAVDRMRREQLRRNGELEVAEALHREEIRRVQSELDEQFADGQRRSIEAARARRAQVEDEVYGVDDSKHRPVGVDPLKTGVGRVTGATARAVGRKKALTRWEYDQMQHRGGGLTNGRWAHLRGGLLTESLAL